MSIAYRAAIACGLTFMALAASAQQSDSAADSRAQDSALENAQQATDLAPVDVRANDWRQYIKAKLKHQMAEVSGTEITVTKKATVTHLDLQPTVIDNNLDQLLVRSPGIQVTQQPTPTQFNLSYRGLGNPQESEYVLVLRDGVPLASDWIGFPTLYAMPLAQSIADVQLIRGGSSLLYGPEPAPVVNLVSKRPEPGAPLSASTEQVFGNHGLYSTYNVIEGSSGNWTFRADAAYVRSDGTRPNADSQLRQGDLYVDYRPDAQQKWWLDLHATQAESGDPGRLGYPQWKADAKATPTPWNRDWVDRYQLLLGHERTVGDWLLTGKLWFGYQDLASRGARGALPPEPPPGSTTVQDEQFRTRGIDVRARRKWGRGNAFTIGAVGFHGDDPFRQWDNPDIYADRYDRSGTPRLRQQRSSDYFSVFAENVFRLPHKFHVVPSIRLERERVAVNESVRPPFLSRALINESDTRTVPLLGLGIGNDFGKGNETYFNVSQGWRPLRYFDMASPFSNVLAGNAPDPSKSLSWEAGVHGVPATGLYYDVSLFWIDFKNRVESPPHQCHRCHQRQHRRYTAPRFRRPDQLRLPGSTERANDGSIWKGSSVSACSMRGSPTVTTRSDRQDAGVCAALPGQGRFDLARRETTSSQPYGRVFGSAILAGLQSVGRQRRPVSAGAHARLYRRRSCRRLADHAQPAACWAG